MINNVIVVVKSKVTNKVKLPKVKIAVIGAVL